jgi:hypothetical protein
VSTPSIPPSSPPSNPTTSYITPPPYLNERATPVVRLLPSTSISPTGDTLPGALAEEGFTCLTVYTENADVLTREVLNRYGAVPPALIAKGGSGIKMVCKYLLSNPLKAVAIVVGGDEEKVGEEEIDEERGKYKVGRIEEKDIEGIYVVPIFRVVIRREGERGGGNVEEETFVEKVLGMQVEGGGVNVTVEAKNKEDADEIIIEWLKGID